MSSPEQDRINFDDRLKPHAYDPITHPEFFDGVLPRRIIAFAIDVLIVTIPVVIVSFFLLLFGIFTFGLGFWLFPLLYPAAIIWAVVYYGMTLGSPASATVGMRTMNIEMRTWYGAPSYFVLGAVHAILFWISLSVLTPLVLIVALFNERGRLLHDLLLGTVVINNEARAASLSRPPLETPL